MKHIWIFYAKELEITNNQSLCYFKLKSKNEIKVNSRRVGG